MAGAAGARRDAVLHARAVLPRRAAPAPASMRIVDAGIAPRRRGGRGSESAGAAAAGFAYLRDARRRGRGRASARDAASRLNQPFFTLMRERTAVRDAQGGDQPRRLHRRGARACARALTSAAGQPARARRSGRSRRDRRRRRDGPGRRSAADRARRVPRAAADARGLRSPAAHAARTPACSRHATPALSSS